MFFFPVDIKATKQYPTQLLLFHILKSKKPTFIGILQLSRVCRQVLFAIREDKRRLLSRALSTAPPPLRFLLNLTVQWHTVCLNEYKLFYYLRLYSYIAAVSYTYIGYILYIWFNSKFLIFSFYLSWRHNIIIFWHHFYETQNLDCLRVSINLVYYVIVDSY